MASAKKSAKQKTAKIPSVIRIESLEPRVLYSAEAAPFLILSDPDSNNSVLSDYSDTNDHWTAFDSSNDPHLAAMATPDPNSNDPAVTTGLVHHYQFQNNGLDAVGAAHATMLNNTSYEPAKVRVGASFEPDTNGLALSLAEIDAAPFTDFGTDYFSVAMWIRTSDPGTQNILLSNMHEANNGFELFTNGFGNISFSVEENEKHTVLSNIDIADGNWYHVSATRGFEGMYMRIHDENGTQVDSAYTYSTAAGNQNVDNNVKITIGALSQDDSDFDGQIDDVRFYARDLSDSDATAIASIGSGPQPQSILNNNEITFTNRTSYTVTPSDLLTVDNESAAEALTYTITSQTSSEVSILLSGNELSIGDTFTQADINDGSIVLKSQITPTSSSPTVQNFSFGFEVVDPVSFPSTSTFDAVVNVEANSAPFFVDTDIPASLNESTPAGTVIGSFSTFDIEDNAVNVQVAAPNNVYFSVAPNNTIILNNTISFEEHPSIELTLVATDAYSSTNSVHTITILDANDAPTIGDAQLSAINEDNFSSAGETISSLASASFSDEDSGASLSGIAINFNPNEPTQGDWEYSLDGSTWVAIGSVSDTQALALPESALLRFVPTGNYFGTPTSMTFRGLDDAYAQGFTTATTPEYVAVTGLNNFGAISQNQGSISITVNAVNDSPQIPTRYMPAVDEDNYNPSGSTISSLYDSVFTDADGDTLSGLVITRYINNAAEGAWQYSTDANTWHHVGTVSNSQALVLSASTLLRFVPAPEYSGLPNALNVRALDSTWVGVYTNGTSRLEVDTTTRPTDSPMSFGNPALRIEVNEVNDTPVANNDNYTVNEASSVSMGLLNNDTDAENDSLNVLIQTNPTNGTLNVLPGGTVTYTHSGNNSTNDSFTYVVSDGNSSSTPATVQITIAPSDDAPVINSVTVPAIVSETTAVGSIIGTVNASDEEGDPFTLSVEAPGNAYFAINAANEIYVANPLDYETTQNIVFDIRATDANGVFGFSTETIVFGDANEAPTITPSALAAINEDDTNPIGETLLNLFNTGFSDVDSGSSLQGFAIDSNTETTNGDWQYSTNNGNNWYNVDAATPFAALVLSASDLIRFLPATNFNGTPDPLELHALDNGFTGTFTSANSRELIYISNATAFGPISLVGAQLSTNVVSVNDVPIAVSEGYSTTEGGSIGGNVLSNDSDADGDILTASITTEPTNGSVNLNPDGSFNYTHNGGSTTNDSFTYTVSDGNQSANAIATITIAGQNDAPVIDSVTIDNSIIESAPVGTVVGVVIASDEDADPITLTIDAPGSDYFTINASNEIVLSAALDYETASNILIDIRVSDTNGASTTYATSILVDDANEAPSINPGSIAAIQESAPNPPGATISSLFASGFSDVDAGSALMAIAIDSNTESANGDWQYSTDNSSTWYDIGSVSPTTALVLAASDLVRFLPEEYFNGTPDPLTLHALDNNYSGLVTVAGTRALTNTSNPSEFGAISIAGVQINTNVLAVNNAPTTVSESYTVSEGSTISGNVLTNDSDIDGDAITSNLQASTQNGILNFFANGDFNYTHDGSTSTTDSFTYNASDGNLSTSSVVNITITPANDAPTFDSINSDSAISEAAPVGTIVGLVTASDEENDAITLTIDTPASDYFTINALNEIELIAPLDHETLSSIAINIRATDSNGAASVAPISIAVDNANEAPAIISTSISDITEDEINASGESILSLFSSGFSDVDSNDSLSGVAINSNTENSNGNWQYSSDNGNSWFDVGTVSTSSSLVLASVDAIRFLPALHFNGTPDPLTLHALDNSYSGGFTNGGTRLSIDVSNPTQYGSISLTGAQLSSTVTPVNNAPTANDDNYTIVEGGTATGLVLDNDFDIDGDSLTTSVLSLPQNGTSDLFTSSFFYTHDGGNTTSDSFTYQVSDGELTAVATVNITIIAENDAPTFDSVSIDSTLSEAAPIGTVVGLVSVSDEENDAITLTLEAPGSNYFSINAANEIVLSAAVDYETLTSIPIVIRATDANNASSSHTSSIAIVDENESPQIASASIAAFAEDSNPTPSSVLSSLFDPTFTDVDAGASLAAIAIVSNTEDTANGAWQYSTDGTTWHNVGSTTSPAALILPASNEVRFFPTNNYNGSPSPLELHAIDDGYTGDLTQGDLQFRMDVSSPTQFGAVSLSGVSLSTVVTSVNDAPTAVNDTYNTNEGITLTNNVSSNDFDVDGDAISATLISAPEHGILEFNPDGGFTYAHDESDNTTDSFTYQLSDGTAFSNVAIVNIIITTTNDAPSIDMVSLDSTVLESASIGTVIGSLSTSDLENDAVDLTIESPQDAYLTINPANEIVVAGPLDHETESTLNFVVRATDANGAFSVLNANIAVIDVNESPAISSTILAAIAEDTSTHTGQTVDTLFSPSFIDEDNSAFLAGIAITANNQSDDGQWQYSNNGSDWQDIGDVAPTAALVLAASDAIRFLPSANFNGTPEPLSVRALDNTYVGSFSDANNPVFIDTSNAGQYDLIGLNNAELHTSITATNDVPTLTNIENTTLSYVENSQAINISSTLSITEPDNGTIDFALVGISTGFNADEDELIFLDTNEDELVFSDASETKLVLSDGNGITGTYDRTNGVLTLVGPATASAFEEALRSVAYNNTSDDPDTSLREIQILVHDEESMSNTVTRLLSVEAINDEQQLNVNDGATIGESGSVIITNSMLSASDVDNDPSAIVYSKNADWQSMVLLVNGQAAETFTQQDVDSGLVEILLTDELVTIESLPMLVNDDHGQGIAFDLIVSVTQPELITEQAIAPEPIEEIPEAIISEVLPIPNISTFTTQPANEPESTSESNSSDTTETAEASNANNTENASESGDVGITSIAINENLLNSTNKIDFAVIANELSTPDRKATRTTDLSAQSTEEIQLASLLSLEPITIETDASITIKNSENALKTSIKQMQEQIARASEQARSASGIQDTVIGFSLSITAGVLIWMLRGGALMASLFAISPLWKNFDPLLLMNKGKDEEEDIDVNEEDEHVEDLFTQSK